jgi:hypothetical protein
MSIVPDKMIVGAAVIAKYLEKCKGLKGTVRPDWICMRVVRLESPLKGDHRYMFLIFYF